MSDNPPAYPTEWSPGLEPGEAMQTGEHTAQYPGMTLRDWFAGQALSEAISISRAGWGRENPVSGFYESAGGMAYKFADAMLAERVK